MDKEMYDCLHEINENLKAIKTNTTPMVRNEPIDKKEYLIASPEETAQFMILWKKLKEVAFAPYSGFNEIQNCISEIDLFLGED